MSTYLYLECLDHDPPIRAEDESGQHLYDLPRIRHEIANREAVVAASLADDDLAEWGDINGWYFRSHSARFLRQHPKCRIGIRDEYGVEHLTLGG